MFKTNALDNVANQYIDRNDALLIPGTRIEADDQNIKQIELVKIVESSGQTLKASGVFTTQADIALTNYASGGAELYEDTGSADVFELVRKSGSEFALPHNYFDGLKVKFVAGNTNTGAATIKIGVALPPIALRSTDGTALTVGEVQAGDEVEATYNGSTSKFEIEQTSQSRVYTPPINGLLKAFRINEVRLGYASGSYSLPLANSVPDGAWVLTEQFDLYALNEPLVERSGADNIEDIDGLDTEVLYDTGSSIVVRYISNGVDTWRI